MTDFESTAELSIEIPPQELREARTTIEGALSDVEVGMSPSAATVSGAGAGGQSRQQTSLLTDIAKENAIQTSVQEDILAILQDLDNELGGGGGGDGPGVRGRRANRGGLLLGGIGAALAAAGGERIAETQPDGTPQETPTEDPTRDETGDERQQPSEQPTAGDVPLRLPSLEELRDAQPTPAEETVQEEAGDQQEQPQEPPAPVDPDERPLEGGDARLQRLAEQQRAGATGDSDTGIADRPFPLEVLSPTAALATRETGAERATFGETVRQSAELAGAFGTAAAGGTVAGVAGRAAIRAAGGGGAGAGLAGAAAADDGGGGGGQNVTVQNGQTNVTVEADPENLVQQAEERLRSELESEVQDIRNKIEQGLR